MAKVYVFTDGEGSGVKITKSQRGSIIQEPILSEGKEGPVAIDGSGEEGDDDGPDMVFEKLHIKSKNNDDDLVPDSLGIPELDAYEPPKDREMTAQEKFLLELKAELIEVRTEIARLNKMTIGMDQTTRFKLIKELHGREGQIVADIMETFARNRRNTDALIENSLKPRKTGTSCILDPQSSFMTRWDPLMVILLAFTATVTPWEVAFAGTTVLNGLFVVNRIVDMGFVIDMFFRTSVPLRRA